MSEIETQPAPTQMISAKYEDQLRERYDSHIVDEITHNWRSAELPDMPGESIPYVRLNEGAGKPILYVPGFTEGIVSKAPFAAELAQKGHDVILPDQNRKKILKDTATDKKSATYSQALNYLAVLEAEGIENVDVVTHSYGSLIFDTMQKIAEERGKNYFADAKVVMLAPAGFNKDKVTKLGKRFIGVLKSEGKGNPKDFPDNPEMLKAGAKNFTANIPRALREVKDLSKKQVDVERLMGAGIADLAIVSYAEDKLYGDDVINEAATDASHKGAQWVTPITQRERFYPTSSKPHATHNDEQFNPYRVAATVDDLLR